MSKITDPGAYWICSLCGKQLARASTPWGSVKGLNSMHFRWKHPDKDPKKYPPRAYVEEELPLCPRAKVCTSDKEGPECPEERVRCPY